VSSAALALVLLAAVIHASWNLLAKQADDKLAFLWCGSLVSTVVYLPLGVWLALAHPVPASGWAVVGVSAALEAGYYWWLARAYRHGDLSLVYPVARGSAPLVVPLFATLFLGERLSALAALGIALVVGGVIALHLPSFGRKGLAAFARAAGQPGTRYALVAGVFIAAYTTLDKRGVELVQPLLYCHLLFVGLTIALLPLLRVGRVPVAAEWRSHRVPIVVIGLVVPLTYGLVLLALTLAPVSYVAAAREVSVVVAAVLGALVLREPYGPQRLLGSALIALGLGLLVVG
jgi:drug/metabolite transporter (DMT)-like permease